MAFRSLAECPCGVIPTSKATRDRDAFLYLSGTVSMALAQCWGSGRNGIGGDHRLGLFRSRIVWTAAMIAITTMIPAQP